MPLRFLFDPPRRRAVAPEIARAAAARRQRQIIAVVLGGGVLASIAVVARQHALHEDALAEWTAHSSVILRLTGTAARAWIAEREGDVHLLTAQAARTPAIFAAAPGQPQITQARLDTALVSTLGQLRRSHGEQYTRIWVFDVGGRVLGSSGGAPLPPAVRSVALASFGVDSVLAGQIFTRADRSSGLAFAQRVVDGTTGTRTSGRLLGSIVLVVEPQIALFPALDGGSVGVNGEATALLMPHGDSVFEYSLTTQRSSVLQVRARPVLPRVEQGALRSALWRTPAVESAAAPPPWSAESVHPVAQRLAHPDVIELVRPVPGVDWAVVRRARPAAVFAAADAELVSECALVLAAIAVGAWALLFRSRSVQMRRTRELAESERQLRGALAFVRALVDNSPVAIVALDLDGTVTFWNAAAERHFGWTAAEVMGKLYPLVSNESWAEVQRHNEETLERGHLTDVHLRRRKKDGTLLDVSLSTGVIHGPGGEPVGILALISDLSERAQLEAQLRQAQKMDAVGRLAGGIAHDFNNLLTVITTYASLLLNDFPADSSPHADVAEIRAAAQRAAGLTSQLLAFSRQQVFDPHVIDVNALVVSMEQMLRRVLPANVALRTELGSDIAPVRVDEGQLGQVLMNLVVNARDAIGDAPGTITITTTCPAETESEVVIAVTDTGCGMPKHVLDRMFEPFFTTKGVGAGTGLGLSTVHGIVEQSGGRIMVESELGHGSTFTLHLPAIPNAHLADACTDGAHSTDAHPDGTVPGRDAGAVTGGSAVHEPHEDSHEELGDGGTECRDAVVLLVEDEARVRMATTRMLTRDGFQVIPAADATEALMLYAQYACEIDLVLTDVAMPGLTGIELVERLRALGSEVPTLFMSGYVERGHESEGVLSDPSRFLQKPFTPDELTRKVREAIARRVATSGAWRVPLGSAHRVPQATP